jgi:hypothetical protein
MTPQEWIAELQRRAELVNTSGVLFQATTDTMGLMAQRIWGEGILSDGSRLTYKEDYEVYIYKPPFPRKPDGKGKPFDLWERKGEVATDRAELRSLTRRARQVARARDAQGNKGKQRKIEGQWAPSYLAAKKSQDRDDLPFELTGDLRLAWAGGVTPTPREVSPTLCVIDLPEKQFKQAKGLAKQKGEFLELTEAEERKHQERLTALLNDIFA